MAKQAFLINPRRKARKTSRRKSPSRKSVPAWVKSKGFATWGAYMASIRPGRKTKGGTVAKRRRRRNAVARPAARRRRRRTVHRNPPASYSANPRRRRRRHSYRRNPPISMSPKGILKTVTNAGMNAVGVLAGKVTARVGRGKIGMVVGTPVGMLTEVAIGVAGGIALKKVSARFAEMFITGAMVSVLEPLAKGFLPASVGGALGDEDGLISGEGSLAGYLNGQGSYDVDPGVGAYELQEA
jgi:hypothetical protein